MATILLQAAGAYLGGLLGSVGAIVGTAAGALAGYVVDKQLISSTQHTEGPRLPGMQPFSAEEGATMTRLYGTSRLSGTMIWATRFEEEVHSERKGIKGGPKLTSYSYFANFALALCEGEIAGIRRMWVDGREMDLNGVEMRVYHGSQTQPPDPLIEAKQGVGNTPAYRGVAYVVFERFPLEEFGNRIPQLQFEVRRPTGKLGSQIRAITMIPGSTEFGLFSEPVQKVLQPGEMEALNRHVFHAGTNLEASLDELQALCPNLEHVALVVAWFGDDLRCNHCKISPRIIEPLVFQSGQAGQYAASDYALTAINANAGAYSKTVPHAWSIAGIDHSLVTLVTLHNGKPAYGGSPADESIIQAIAALKRRNIKVTLYPFVMMDIASDNSLPDPYGAATQAPYPWRGRISCPTAPTQVGSEQGSAVIREYVTKFMHGLDAGAPFLANDVLALNQQNLGYRRLVLHYAALAAQAGGVDAFLVGSEMRGLTQLHDENDEFPFVEAMRSLAGEVRAILGGSTKITYGADWSEYFGYVPQDGSGNFYYNLDALWADDNIDAIGIDNYMPLSDWRDSDWSGDNLDAQTSPHDEAAFSYAISNGEGYDWYYANQDDRNAKIRTPITDGAHDKPWVYRYKDLASWWSNPHYNRKNGIEVATPSPWVPFSKPFWMTELGCPAVDKGANQPNVFVDPKSSENAYPYFSNAGRDDLVQRRFLQAHFNYWDPAAAAFSETNNPISPLNGQRMVDHERIYVWTWDARPYPAFPLRTDYWGDGENWLRGHWINGRLDRIDLGETINAILSDYGLPRANVTNVNALADAIVLYDATSLRELLANLATTYGLTISEYGGQLTISSERSNATGVLINDRARGEGEVELIRKRMPDHEIPNEVVFAFRDPLLDYQTSSVRAYQAGYYANRQQVLRFPGALQQGDAQVLMDDWFKRIRAARTQVTFFLPPHHEKILPGSFIKLPEIPNVDFLIEEIEEGITAKISARRVIRSPSTSNITMIEGRTIDHSLATSRANIYMLDLPLFSNESKEQNQLRIAAWSRPWKAQLVQTSRQAQGFVARNVVKHYATMGSLLTYVPKGRGALVEEDYFIDVKLRSGELESVSRLEMLNGENVAAIRTNSGIWEIIQFQNATEFEADHWRLSGLLRGQLGTSDAMNEGCLINSPFVLLDERVQPVGLKSDEMGVDLNWRVSPNNSLDDDTFAHTQSINGQRALKPFAPVHLQCKKQIDGSLDFSWIRRSRINADSWLASDIPLGEEREVYQLKIYAEDGTLIVQTETTIPSWNWSADGVSEALGSTIPAFSVELAQMSSAIGEGIVMKRDFSF